MVKIAINLASEPFEQKRRIVVATAAGAGMLLGLLALLISLSVMESGQAVEVRKEIAGLEARVQALAADRVQLENVLRRPENAEVLQRSLFLNNLIYAKGISWTRMFDDLEKVLPHNVRLIAIRPQVNEHNQVSLDMMVGSESSEPVVQFLMRLEATPQFGSTLWHQRMPPSQNDPLLRNRVSVNYSQTL